MRVGFVDDGPVEEESRVDLVASRRQIHRRVRGGVRRVEPTTP